MRRSLTRGATAQLKRGAAEATRRLAPLRQATGWIHVWVLLEIFSGMSEPTVQAGKADGWQAL